MNIFVTDSDPIKSAQFLDNKRVIKMILESAQMLSTALHFYGVEAPYKSTHVNHPCNIWCRSNKSNYGWLLKHFKALCEEYTFRYNKVHKCEQYFKFFKDNIEALPSGELTDFVNCAANRTLGYSYRHMKNTVLAYQLYLFRRWLSDKRDPKFT